MDALRQKSRVEYLLLDTDLSGDVTENEKAEFVDVLKSYRGAASIFEMNSPTRFGEDDRQAIISEDSLVGGAGREEKIEHGVELFSKSYTEASQPKYTMLKGFFLQMFVVGVISLGIYVKDSRLAYFVYVVVLLYDVLIAALCILQQNHSQLLRRLCPSWIFSVSEDFSTISPIEQEILNNRLVESVDSPPNNWPYFSFYPKRPTRLYFDTWNFKPPFMVFFTSQFNPNTTILGCRVPFSVHPAVVICLRLGNTCILTAGLIWRLAVISFNERLGFSGFAYAMVPCAVSEPPPYCMPPSLIGTAHYMSIILSGCLWVASMFKLQDRAVDGQEKSIFDLNRFKLSFNLYYDKSDGEEPGATASTSAFDLWTELNHMWRQSCSEHIFGKIAGFADTEVEISGKSSDSIQTTPEKGGSSPLRKKMKRESVLLRLCFLSQFPILLAIFQTFLVLAARNPTVGAILRLTDCDGDSSCASYKASPGISTGCETDIVYSILVSANYAPVSSLLINLFVIIGTFIMVCGVVHILMFMTTLTFFFYYLRLQCVTRTIHPMLAMASKTFCPFVPLSSGKQIRSWIQLYHLEKMGGNMRFGEASVGLSSYFCVLIILGACEVAVVVLKQTIPAIGAFACYWMLVAVFFLVSLVFAALSSEVQGDIVVNAREQQFILGNREEMNTDGESSNRQCSDRIDSLITHLGQTDVPQKLLRFIPANFLVLQVLLSYCFTVVVAVGSLLFSRGS
jgi:hypothetical protein